MNSPDSPRGHLTRRALLRAGSATVLLPLLAAAPAASSHESTAGRAMLDLLPAEFPGFDEPAAIPVPAGTQLLPRSPPVGAGAMHVWSTDERVALAGIVLPRTDRDLVAFLRELGGEAADLGVTLLEIGDGGMAVSDSATGSTPADAHMVVWRQGTLVGLVGAMGPRRRGRPVSRRTVLRVARELEAQFRETDLDFVRRAVDRTPRGARLRRRGRSTAVPARTGSSVPSLSVPAGVGAGLAAFSLSESTAVSPSTRRFGSASPALRPDVTRLVRRPLVFQGSEIGEVDLRIEMTDLGPCPDEAETSCVVGSPRTPDEFEGPDEPSEPGGPRFGDGIRGRRPPSRGRPPRRRPPHRPEWTDYPESDPGVFEPPEYGPGGRYGRVPRTPRTPQEGPRWYPAPSPRDRGETYRYPREPAPTEGGYIPGGPRWRPADDSGLGPAPRYPRGSPGQGIAYGIGAGPGTPAAFTDRTRQFAPGEQVTAGERVPCRKTNVKVWLARLSIHADATRPDGYDPDGDESGWGDMLAASRVSITMTCGAAKTTERWWISHEELGDMMRGTELKPDVLVAEVDEGCRCPDPARRKVVVDFEVGLFDNDSGSIGQILAGILGVLVDIVGRLALSPEHKDKLEKAREAVEKLTELWEDDPETFAEELSKLDIVRQLTLEDVFEVAHEHSELLGKAHDTIVIDE
ncbi:hypothetical protein [Haloarchaeobius sp. HME9146]|uniref:hypothetical protein n=1 Tax=Haloarchaeobius sp. HME9146 TaxID=2978732 RepID=UPI0021BE37F5|nr:hypothetical protein [Haloarchaeobius sp. HME9146]MCT9096671.1 hypothetical protein [Haloarchaeobius sp. HME9146]